VQASNERETAPNAAPGTQAGVNTTTANQPISSQPIHSGAQPRKSPAPKSQKASIPSLKHNATIPPPNSTKRVNQPRQGPITSTSPSKERVKVRAAVPATSKPFSHRIPVSKGAVKPASIPITIPMKTSQSAAARSKEPRAESSVPVRQNGIFSFVPQSLKDVLSRSLSSDVKASTQVPGNKSVAPPSSTEVPIAGDLMTSANLPMVSKELSILMKSTARSDPKTTNAPVALDSPKQTSKLTTKKRALELTPTKPKGNDQRLKRQKLSDDAEKEAFILLEGRRKTSLVPARPQLEILESGDQTNFETIVPKPPIFTSKADQVSSATLVNRPHKKSTEAGPIPVAARLNLAIHQNPMARQVQTQPDADIFGSQDGNQPLLAPSHPPKNITVEALELPSVSQPLEVPMAVQKRSKDLVDVPVRPRPTIEHPVPVPRPNERNELPSPITVPLQPKFAPLPPTVSREIGVLDDLDDYTMRRVPEVRESKQPSINQEGVSKRRTIIEEELDEPCRLTIPISPKFMRTHKVRDQAKEAHAMQSVRAAERANRRHPLPSSKRTNTGAKEKPLPPVRFFFPL
jgi:hypothetical protein